MNVMACAISYLLRGFSHYSVVRTRTNEKNGKRCSDALDFYQRIDLNACLTPFETINT